jgi:hypothetical protein
MYSKGISWIDDCRIPFVDEGDKQKGKIHDAGGNGEGKYNWNTIIKKSGNEYRVSQGRFPANLLVSDDMLNDGKIYKSGEVKKHHKRNKTLGEYQGNAYGKFNNINPELNYENYYGDKGTNSRYYDIDRWFNNLIDV